MSELDLINTPGGMFRLRRARPEDADAILLICEEAASWLTGRGIDQWEPGSFERAPLLDEIAHGYAYLASCVEQPAGTLTLSWADPPTWGRRPDDAGYVHALAVRRAFAGQQLGRGLLAWAERTAAAAGKTYLRLDCVAHNERLNQYYRDAGFAFRGVMGTRRPVSLYEKRIAGTPTGPREEPAEQA
jgi:ribosomal protein S18 acetylase RimI-like enzyme